MKTRILLTLWLGLLASGAGAQPVLRWAPSDPTVDLGGQVTLEIMLDEALAVRTFEFVIEYDAAVLTTVGGGPGALFDGLNLFSGLTEVDPAHPGVLHGYCVVLGADDWATGPGSLFRWTVRGDQAGSTDLLAATVRLLPPGGGEYETTSLPATTVTVDGSSPVALGPNLLPRLQLYPNPFNPRTTIAFAATAAAAGRLDVFDVQGRRVVRLWQGDLGAGGAVAWDGRGRDGNPLPSGVYTFLLSGPDGGRSAVRGTLVR